MHFRRSSPRSCSGSTRCASCFALDATSASTIGLLIGTIPIFAALFGVALGRERLSTRFWAAAAISSVGVAFVAVGSAGDVSGGYGGILLGLVTAATWAAYSVAVTPLMQSYSPSQVSAIVISGAWVLIALVGLPVNDVAGLGCRMERSGRSSSWRPSGRSSSRTSCGSAPSRSARLGRRSPRICSRSSPPSWPWSFSRRRSACADRPAECSSPRGSSSPVVGRRRPRPT